MDPVDFNSLSKRTSHAVQDTQVRRRQNGGFSSPSANPSTISDSGRCVTPACIVEEGCAAQQGYDTMRQRHRDWFRHRPLEERERLREAQFRAQQQQQGPNGQSGRVQATFSSPDFRYEEQRGASPTSARMRHVTDPLLRGMVLRNEWDRIQELPRPGEGGLNAMDIITSRQRQTALRTSPREIMTPCPPGHSRPASRTHSLSRPDRHGRRLGPVDQGVHSASSNENAAGMSFTAPSSNHNAQVPRDWREHGPTVVSEVQQKQHHPLRPRRTVSDKTGIEHQYYRSRSRINSAPGSVTGDCESQVSPSHQSLYERHVRAQQAGGKPQLNSLTRYQSFPTLPTTDERSPHASPLRKLSSMNTSPEARETCAIGPDYSRLFLEELQQPQEVGVKRAAVPHNDGFVNFSRPFLSENPRAARRRDTLIQSISSKCSSMTHSPSTNESIWSTSSLQGDAMMSKSRLAKEPLNCSEADAYAIFERDVERSPRLKLSGGAHVELSGNILQMTSIDSVLEGTQDHKPDTRIRFLRTRQEKGQWWQQW